MENNYRMNKANWEKVCKLDEQIKLLENERNLYIEAWKKQLAEEGVMRKTIGNGIATIGWKITIQKRFDSSAFKAKHADLYDEFKVAKEIKTFEH